jgi:hypothetical protein
MTGFSGECLACPLLYVLTPRRDWDHS